MISYHPLSVNRPHENYLKEKQQGSQESTLDTEKERNTAIKT